MLNFLAGTVMGALVAYLTVWVGAALYRAGQKKGETK